MLLSVESEMLSSLGALGFLPFGLTLGNLPFPLGSEMERDCVQGFCHFGMEVEACHVIIAEVLSEGCFMTKGPVS